MNNNPKNFKGVFSICVNQDNQYKIDEIDQSNNTYRSTLKNNLFFNWNEKWGEIDQALKNEYELQCDISGKGDNFTDVKEFVIPVKKFHPKSVFNPVQHSFECYNPYIQSNVDSSAIFSGPSGLPYVLSDFRSISKYLFDHFQDQVIHINPNWDMKSNYAGQLVEHQLKLVIDNIKSTRLSVPIEPSTVSAFVKYNQSNNLPYDNDQFEKLVKIVSCFEKNGVLAKVVVCDYLRHHIDATGTMPCNRNILKLLMSTLNKEASSKHRLDPNPAADALIEMADATARAYAKRNSEQNKSESDVDLKQKENVQCRSPGMRSD